ncbi:MAG: AraC family transcriptional regulator [Clostridia bacterium]|nr:AraC family transcriptional regulator [Clostridia bacterium]
MKGNTREFIFENRGLKDLNPIIAGNEKCAPSHTFGPAVRGYYLLHYVLAGKGTLYKGGRAYLVRAGEAFLILPGEVTTYRADEQDPWQYTWLGFDGELADRFSELPPVFPLPAGLIQEPLREPVSDNTRVYALAAELFRLYAFLFSEKKGENRYVKRVEDYIRALYMQPLRVEDIARSLNLDRRYLSRLFKEKTGVTVLEFLISVRMEAAARHLEKGASVLEAAQLSGYGDVSNFSKMFKKRYGVSPNAYKARGGAAVGKESS